MGNFVTMINCRLKIMILFVVSVGGEFISTSGSRANAEDKNLLNLIAGAVEESDVTYYLFNNLQPVGGMKLDGNMPNIFDRNSSVVFVIHGWRESRKGEKYEGIKNALLSRTDRSYTVILVDWSGPASKFYPESAGNTKEVGRIVAKRILQLSQDVPLRNFHVIGHSLGGQVAGFVGKFVTELSGSKLTRITALDPAGPFFGGFFISSRNRLNSTDAKMVVVLHSDGGAFGYREPCGTIDIFANGGSGVQPGCPPMSDVFCSHRRSVTYYIEAVQTRDMVATECNSYSLYLSGKCRDHRKIDIGDDITQEHSGNYYFRTNSDAPYGKGAKSI